MCLYYYCLIFGDTAKVVVSEFTKLFCHSLTYMYHELYKCLKQSLICP